MLLRNIKIQIKHTNKKKKYVYKTVKYNHGNPTHI